MEFVQQVRDMNPENLGWRAPEVCQLTGCSYRQLDYWCRTGLIYADIKTAKGSGSQRLFSNELVILIWVLMRLLEMGASLRFIRRWGIVESVIAFATSAHDLEGVLIAANILGPEPDEEYWEGSDLGEAKDQLARMSHTTARAEATLPVSSLSLVGSQAGDWNG